MKLFDPNEQSANRGSPDDELRVAVTFNPAAQPVGPTRFSARLSANSIDSFRPDPLQKELAIAELARRGFKLTGRGAFSASMRCTRQEFEALFKTKLVPMSVPGGSAAQFSSVFYPPSDANWQPDPAVSALLDDVYIQWPHIYLAKPAAKKKASPKTTAGSLPSAVAPKHLRYYNLAAPDDIARMLNARAVHQMGITGAGVRVAMIDSGFDHRHPFFAANGARSSVVLAPGASDRLTDSNGHGTGESANIFAAAPDVTFIGVKLDNEQNRSSGASVLEGLQEALRHDPHVISVSLGYDLRASGSLEQLDQLPHNLIALEAEIHAAIQAGKVFVFSAGNGQFCFPAQMPDVVSAGGVYVDQHGAMQASDYASAFPSRIYPGRSVPDLCGLVGMQPYGAYLALPVPSGSALDRECAQHDKTRGTDGWGVFSGTSAAAPQLAGICALLLQASPGLSPREIKAILRRTARDVLVGHANPFSDASGQGIAAGPNEDGATGAGLVDALAAVKQLL